MGLYVVTAAIVLAGRVGAPLVHAFRYRLRVLRVVDAGPTAASIEVGGRGLDRLAARSGQFFTWRFLTRDHWWEAHPFSLSASPDGRRLRITVKGLGDFTERVRSIPPGTRVIAEGPFGAFTAASRRRRRVALIAGGVGITPIRALLEDMPGAPGDIAVVYRSARAADVILRDELDELAARRGAGDPLSDRRAAFAVRRRPAGPRPRHRGAPHLCIRAGGDDPRDASDATALRRARRPDHYGGLLPVRRAVAILALTAAVVVALARFHTEAPRVKNPLSALHGRPAARTPAALAPGPRRPPTRPGVAPPRARRWPRRSHLCRCK